MLEWNNFILLDRRFILYPKICQNKSIPKWTPWSRQAVYLGILTHHAGSVALVLNIKTGYISPQFHIVFDDVLTTIIERITNKLPWNWDNIFKKHHELPPEEFQFIKRKQWKNLTDRSEEDLKVNNKSPSNQTEGADYRSIDKIYSLSGSKSELPVEKTTTPALVWLEREIMNMLHIMYCYKLDKIVELLSQIVLYKQP